MNLPIFIINLAFDVQKKEHMQSLCLHFGLNVEFIEAVDGNNLTKKALSSVYSPKNAIEAFGREMTKGEVGTALSHKIIYEKIINKNIKAALILEDDVTFDEKLINVLALKHLLPYNWEAVLLGHHSERSREDLTKHSIWFKKPLIEGVVLRRPCEIGYGAYGYCISNKGAKNLYNALETISLPIDHYTGNDQYLNLYVIEQPLILLHNELTEMSNLADDRKRMAKKFSQQTKVRGKTKFKLKNIAKLFGMYRRFINFRMGLKSLIMRIKPYRRYH
ncbi:glycosyltransferase family 25 protein [Methylophilaceae bacterium Uisw_099_01]